MENPTPLRDIFAAALEIESAVERQRYLDDACGNDSSLREQVEMLIESHHEAGSFLAADDLDATVLSAGINQDVGTTIGPYKLLEQIGEGGMGTVYLAAQSEPVKREVALKLIKTGMDTKDVVARFDAERQALAMMNHPNIAKVLDAGATEAGRPYFVMELVKGLPITEFCDERRIDLPQRLNLFRTVCEAVQHAHQKGIVHRDIKPSNVMVTLCDSKLLVKVIDFGVAKALHQKLTDQTMWTGAHQILGTPTYMSPEQADLGGTDIDTRTDVYSLGVLLYELLTGTTPFSRHELKRAGMEEICRILREQEPAKPSTRISSLGETLPGVAAVRKLEPKRLSAFMRGDLDWIVMKSLEKDRERRYATANAFAEDIERYLLHEPVEASQPSAAYRFRKFAMRNRKLLTTMSAFVVMMTVASVVSLWQASQARTARDAERQQRMQADANFEKALQAVDQMLTRVADESLVDVPQMTPVRMQLFDDAIRFYQELLIERPRDTRLRYKLAVVQGRAALVAAELSEKEFEFELIEASVKSLEQLVDRQPMNPTYAGALAESLRIAGKTRRWHLGDLNAIVSYNERGAEIARRADASIAYGRSLGALGAGHIERADYPAAIEVLKEAIPLLQSSFNESTDKKEQSLGNAYNALGRAYANLRDYANAVDALRSAVNTNKQVLELRPESLSPGRTQMRALFLLAGALRDSGDTESAITTFREGLEFSLKLEKRFPSARNCDGSISYFVRDLCRLLQRSGRETEILPMIDGLVPATSNDFTVRGMLHSSVGDIEPATEDFNRAIEINPKNWVPTQELVKIHMRNDDGEKAVELHRTFMLLAPLGLKTTYYPFDSQRLSAMQCRLGDLEEARRTLIRAFERNSRIDFKSLMNSEDKLLSEQNLLAAETFVELNPTRLEAHVLRSTIQAACGKLVDAEKSFASTYEMVDQLQWSDEMDSATKNDRINACGILLDAFSVWNENGRSDLARKASDYSMTLASKLRRQFPDDAGIEVVEKHAEHLYRNLAPKDAIAELSRLIDEMGAFSALYRYRGCAFRDIKRFDEALTDLDKAIELLSDDGEMKTYMSRGILFVEMKQYEKAIADYDKYVELSSKNQNASAHIERGEFYLNVVKNYKQAIIDFDFALEKTPHHAHWYKRRAVALFGLNRFDEALADLNTCLDWNPSDTSTVTWIGTGQIANCSDEAFRTGMRTLADRSVELNDSSVDSLVARAVLLIALGELQQARKDLDALDEWEDASYSTLYYAALLALANDDVPRCQELCQQMLSRFESSDTAIELHFAAWSCVLDPRALDDYALAMQLAQQAVDADPENQQYISGLGAVEFRAGQYAKALENLTAAAGSDESSNTSSAYIAYFLAMTEYQLDRQKDAIASLARANELALQEINDADNPPIWNRKLTLELLRKEAESMIGETTDGGTSTKQDD